MNTIQIETQGSELETIVITLDEAQVTALYNQNKALNKELTEVKAQLDREKQNYKWACESRDTANNNVKHANMLLTALGVQEQTTEEESYRRTELPVATRIALYIATNK